MNMPKPFTKKRSQGALSATNVNNKKCEPMQNCFNLDDMMQFEAARQRALAHFVPENDSKLFNEFVANRIFINNVDLFNGSYYVKYLSQIKEPEIEGEGASDGEELGTEFPSTEEDNEEPNEETFEEDDNSSKDSSSVKPGKAQRRPSFSFELVGSIDFVNNPKYIKSEAIMELFDNEKKSQFLEKVLSCGVIIYDITSTLYCHPKQIEEAMWVAESIHRRLEYLEKSQPRVFQKYTDCRTLILVSTLLTWAKTKPIDPDDPTLPFTERDFRKRKAHPNYKVHCELEKKIIELGKKHPKHFRTIVIGSGVTYGHEEDVLHYLFKMAWKDHPHLPIFGTGKNIIPVIHINSLSSIIHNVIVKFPEKYHYLIAMDPESITLKEITKLLAKTLGNGKTLKVTSEEAMLYPDIKQRIYDMLTANINIVPGYILDKMTVNWATDRPLRENIDNMITEFKEARGLLV
ncbi:hypothetical protein RUM44_000417 [Polyplax serrata]|uniref:Uncharacterized protein n=1 Tax=Polyplax serrata TaxID=468196 RepID=A0ABR1B5D5_POLSC